MRLGIYAITAWLLAVGVFGALMSNNTPAFAALAFIDAVLWDATIQEKKRDDERERLGRGHAGKERG